MTTLDFSLYDDVILTDEVSAALQELDMIFNTDLTEVLGETSFGSKFESFLWELSPDPSRLKTYIIDKINQTYYASRFPYSVTVRLTSDTIAQVEASGGDTSVYSPDSTYVVSIDLYGNDQNNAGTPGATKIVMF
jgi:hypothetical protein